MKLLSTLKIAAFCFLCLKSLSSQTSIEPIVGLSFAKNSGLTDFKLNNWSSGAISDSEFQTNLFLGLGITQHINEHILINTTFQYSENKMKYVDTGFAGYPNLKFRRIAITTIPTINIAENIQLGVGISYQLLRNFNIGFDELNFWTSFSDSHIQDQFGWVASAAYEIKSLVISTRFYNLKALNPKSYHHVDKTKTLEISVAYRFNVFNTKKEASSKR